MPQGMDWSIQDFVKAGSSNLSPLECVKWPWHWCSTCCVACWAGGIMTGWRMRAQRHVPSPLIPRPDLFATTWPRRANKDTGCYWLQSKPPSAHFLSSPGFLSLVNRITMKLSPSRSMDIKDTDVSCSQKVMRWRWCLHLLLQPAYLWGRCNDKLDSKGAIIIAHCHQHNLVYAAVERSDITKCQPLWGTFGRLILKSIKK